MDVISPEPCPKPFGDILSETGALVEPLSLATGSNLSLENARAIVQQAEASKHDTSVDGAETPHDDEIPAQPRRSRRIDYIDRALRNTGHPLGGSIRPKRLSHDKKTNQVPKLDLDDPQVSLQTILAGYIQKVDPLMARGPDTDTADDLNAALQEVFGEAPYEHLRSMGYGASDVVSWAWILKSRDPHEATWRLFTLEADRRSRTDTDAPAIPSFIPLFLLKGKYLERQTFRLLLIYSLHLMSGLQLPVLQRQVTNLDKASLPDTFRPKIDPVAFMDLAISLMFHARQVWPEALVTIARASVLVLTSSNQAAQYTDAGRCDRFNFILGLLAKPIKKGPFRFFSIQQQAQFEILKAMATHEPVVPVIRQGYRALIAVQLTHKKTVEERQSAELKAPSWPPWKEEKLGIDSQRGNDGRFSRAMLVIAQMREAGYRPGHLENISAVLAGWDTDGSPTVQTRSLMRPPTRSLHRAIEKDPQHPWIWMARIRATRTVREAWACFLTYQDNGFPPSEDVYAAMAEKLIYRRKTIERKFDDTAHALPGDGREVYPEPASARDIIYIRTEPPTLDELLEDMLSKGLRPARKFLALLLSTAPSFHSGLHYLNCSSIGQSQKEALTTVWRKPSQYKVQDLRSFQEIPDYLFGAFIGFLCRHTPFGDVNSPYRASSIGDLFPILFPDFRLSHSTQTLFDYNDRHLPHALPHAIELTKLRDHACTPAWLHILTALSRKRTHRPRRKIKRNAQWILAWHEALEVVELMQRYSAQPDTEALQSMCVVFTKAVAAGLNSPHDAKQGLRIVRRTLPPRASADFDDMVQTGLQALKDRFDHLVTSSPKSPEAAEQSIFTAERTQSPLTVPPILQVPTPAALHAFVRALGTAGDDDGLLNLLLWMSRSADVLNETSDAYMNGDIKMHRILVAIRAFLEKEEDRVESASASAVQEAFDIISRTPDWTWPSDWEVQEYRTPLDCI
ncbi:uncharacterized protein PFLUO_LOCUS6747 [Penicillium psychrofluorescens]|uniref:uncharacterized protein n=1 Tax=Penicillium psychrofluorescens TaxID=3158075 RepID=UPI003CCCF971